MSRSRKKHPYISITRAGLMKDWKTECSRNVRRIPVEFDIGDKSYVRKIITVWDSPCDGVHIYDKDKGYRK